jgi:nitrogen fixation protein NifB
MEPIEDAVMAVYKEMVAAGKLEEAKTDCRATA